jgi:signal peptidase I
VAFWTGKELFVKRVIALPGEDVAAVDGTFFINGQPLPEPYLRYRDHCNFGSDRLSSNQFVVAGDNRLQSLVMVIRSERIVGRISR